MTAVLEAPLASALARPRKPIVVRFPDIDCVDDWKRLPGLMRSHGCLAPGAARLSRFFSHQEDAIDLDGRVSIVDDWTGEELGGEALAKYYSNWATDRARKGLEIACKPHAFYTDVNCLIAAGLTERAGKTTRGTRQGYVLVISSTAIERLPPNTVGPELAAAFRIDLMAAALTAPEPEADDDHVVIGGISRAARENPAGLLLDEPVTLAAALTVEGRSEEFAKQLAAQAAAEAAVAPRWEHPAASSAGRVAARVREATGSRDELAVSGLAATLASLDAAVAAGLTGDAVDILTGPRLRDGLAAVAAAGRAGKDRLLDGVVARGLEAARGAVAGLDAAVAAEAEPLIAARLHTAHEALCALMSSGLGEALAARPQPGPDTVVVTPAALAVAAPLPEVLKPARPRRRRARRPVDNRPSGRARKTMIQSDSFYLVGQMSLPSGLLPAVTRMRAYQEPDGKAKPKTTPQRAAGAELSPAELRAGGGFALAIRRRWKATAGLPEIPDVASWTDDGEAVTTPEWEFFVTTITLALQRCDRNHVWLRATEDLRTLFDLLSGVGARLWKEIIKPRPPVWPANRAPHRAERYGTSVAAAAAEWIAGDFGQDPAEAVQACAESVLDGLYADEQHHRIGLWELERDLAKRLAAEKAAGSVTPPAGDATQMVRGQAVPSRTIRAADDAARAAAAEANRRTAEAARAAAAQREQEAQAMYARWGLDVAGAAAAARAAADVDAPPLRPGELESRARSEADRLRGRRTVADRAREILGDQADDEQEG